MSNVIKDAEGFVPKQIVSGNFPEEARWENLAKKLEDPPPAQTSQERRTAVESAAASPSMEEAAQRSFDSDFSSPAPQQEAPEPEVQIDIDAIAEEYFAKGVQEGREQVLKEYGMSLKALQTACEQLNTIRETILKNSMPEMQELVIRIVEKLLRLSVASQHQTILKTVEDAVQQTIASEDFVILVNPEDLAVVQSHTAEIIGSINGMDNVVIKGNQDVEQGGCIIESNNCTVDASLMSQLEIIDDALKTA